ncbi:COG1470 family protein [Oribacterium sp. HCP28S3_H8]|jgi:uncharacterized membrane protein|uniref:COG1470 family protein n=1 Tax=Oribacterium sp. HCP28S3_H8 TaxID=3438945 RepID=UPI0030590B9A|nr:NEW3 domain-containing protein [Oribacterium sp.]
MKTRNVIRKFTAAAAGMMLTAAMTLSGAIPAFADGGLDMSTAYPGISVKPGDAISFNLDFTNAGAGESVALSASKLPDGFTGYFEGDGKNISNVYVKNGDNDKLASYNVTVPDNAAEGSYTVTLNAAGESNADSITLTMNVSSEELGSSKLTTEYPEQEGAAGTTFTFNSTIQNNSSNNQSFSLSAQAPDGWKVAFTPSGASTQVASADVDAEKSQGVTITVTPPDGVQAGDYTIPISAVSASENLTSQLKVTITGTYGLKVQAPSGLLSFNANANKKTAVTVDVVNDGNIALNNINLTSTAPSDWKVEFSESSIDSLDAGATKEVTMYVTPSNAAVSGDYAMTVQAATTATTAKSDFRVTVKTQTVWGLVGVVLIAAIVAGLAGVFKKYGRH